MNAMPCGVQVLVVSEEEIVAAMRLVWMRMKIVIVSFKEHRPDLTATH